MQTGNENSPLGQPLAQKVPSFHPLLNKSVCAELHWDCTEGRYSISRWNKRQRGRRMMLSLTPFKSFLEREEGMRSEG